MKTKEEFFKEEGVISRIEKQNLYIRSTFKKENREASKMFVNQFIGLCEHNIKKRRLASEAELEILSLLNNFGSFYQCIDTLENVISRFNELKSTQVFSRHNFKSEFYLSYALINFYQIENGIDISAKTKKALERLIEGKNRLYRLYIKHVENIQLLSKPQIGNLFLNLTAALLHSHRYIEAFDFITKAESLYPDSAQLKYMKVKVLYEIKCYTCLSYNAFLLMEIADVSEKALNNSLQMDIQNQQMKVIRNDVTKLLIKNGYTLSDLKSHKESIAITNSNFTKYQWFLRENNLYLNEHNLYCKCKSSMKDSLKIKTEHNHTKNKWVEEIQVGLDYIIQEYNLCRYLYFIYLQNSNINGTSKVIEDKKHHFDNALIKNSFKMCYTILDNMVYFLLDSLDVDYDRKRKDIYFHKLHKLEIIPKEIISQNEYVEALISMSYEVDDSNMSAFKNFRRHRNNLEHRFTIIEIDKENISDKWLMQNKTEFVYLTIELIKLLKSAIFTLVYALRRQSAIKGKSSC